MHGPQVPTTIFPRARIVEKVTSQKVKDGEKKTSYRMRILGDGFDKMLFLSETNYLEAPEQGEQRYDVCCECKENGFFGKCDFFPAGSVMFPATVAGANGTATSGRRAA